MSVRRLPDRPNLDQLKLQAKELLAAWRGGGSTDAAAPPAPPRLRDAQRALAQQYGFDSWDALRAHVEAVSGASSARRKPREVLDYDDPVPAVVELNEPLTADVVERLIEQRVSGVKAGPRVEAGTLSWLAEIPTLQRIDLTWRADLLDGHLAFLEAMPWLTALSLARCSRVTDRAVERIRNHERLERINLQWTGTGDAAMAALAGKPSLSRVLAGASLTDAGVSHLRSRARSKSASDARRSCPPRKPISPSRGASRRNRRADGARSSRCGIRTARFSERASSNATKRRARR
jgi:hypothetical protein